MRKLMPLGVNLECKLAGRQTVRTEQQLTSDMQLSMPGGGSSPPEDEDVGFRALFYL